MKSFKPLIRSSFVLIIITIIAVALPMSAALANADGPRNPQVGNNLAGVGTEVWQNPENITTAGIPYAQVDLFQDHEVSNYLVASTYGIQIPEGAEILGIELVVNRYSGDHPSILDNDVRLVKAGAVVGETRKSATPWPTSLGTATYGGPTDLWGTTWTREEVIDSGFGAALSVLRKNSGKPIRSAYVDTMQITVYYSLSTTIDVTCDSPVTYGSSKTCTATVTRVAGSETPSGNVSWGTDGAGNFTTESCVQNTNEGKLTCTATYTPTQVGSKIHIITGTYTGDQNFSISSDFTELEVDPLLINVTAEDKNKTYGDADPALTYTYSPALVGEDAFTGELTRDIGENVGQHDITQGNLELSANYTLVFTGAKLTIDPKTINVRADAENKTYGDEDPALTYTYSPELVGNDTFTGGLTRDIGEDVGQHDITQGDLALSANYTLVFTGAKLTIDPKTINVTAEDKSKTYGDADPALTYTYSPALVGEDAFTGELTRDIGENVGQHDITQGDLALSANYTLVFTGARLTIDPKTINVRADAESKTYGDEDPTLTYTYNPELAGNDTFSGGLTRDIGEDVGQYDITQGDLALSANYTLVFTGSKLTIVPKTIYVRADAKSKAYGDNDPVLTYVHTPALVGDDTFTGALARDPGENIGPYNILKGTLSLSSNYSLTFVSNTFMITLREVTVTADAQTKVYGQSDPELTYQVTAGSLLTGDEFSGTLTRVAGENVGSYTILQGTLTLPPEYYHLNFVVATLTITGHVIWIPIIQR